MSPSRTDATEQHWREVRAIVLARDERRCKGCGELCPDGEADVHHLVPRAAGGVDAPANLITRCDGCHAARHPNLQGTLARRVIERWGLRLAKWLDRRGETERGIDERYVFAAIPSWFLTLVFAAYPLVRVRVLWQ